MGSPDFYCFNKLVNYYIKKGGKAMNLNVLAMNEAIAPRIEVQQSNTVTSYFQEALSFVTENRNLSMDIQHRFYREVLEAGTDSSLLLEASDGLIGAIKSIIDKFIAFIKKIVAKFITSLKSLVKSDKYLKKHKDRFKDFSSDNEFEMSIYKYTHIQDDSFPNTNAYNVWKTNDFSKANSVTTDIVKYSAQVYDDFIEGLEDWYDKFRGVVLTDADGDQIGSNVPSYTPGEFSKELKEKFRNGDSTPTSTTITSTEVIDAYNRFESYDKTISSIEKMKKKLEKEYNDIKKEIKNLPAAYGDNDAWTSSKLIGSFKNDNGNDYDSAYNDPETKKKVDANITSFIKAKTEQIDKMCTIHSLAFSAKLDACKECYAQDKALLYKALKQINKTYNFMSESVISMNELD